MKYQPPYGVTDPNAPYVNGNPAEGIQGSIPPAAAIEYPQREIVNMITKGGFAPDDSDLYQLTRAARRALFAYAIDTGSVNALSVALDPPLTSYAAGLEVRVLVSADNTGACTIRINGLATQQIVKKDGSQLFSGDLRANGIVVLVHDGTNFQMVSGAAGSVTVGGTGWYNGADYVVDVGTANHIVGTPLVAPTAYAAGQGFAIYVKARNTGPVDVNLNALGVKPLLLPSGQQLSLGDIIPNMMILVRYDGTSFIMMSQIDRAIIGTAATFIVGPNASPVPDFADLNIAFEWLGRRRIGRSGSVTFSLQGQTTGSPVVHTYNSSLMFAHPDGDRVIVQGAGMNNVPTQGSFTTHGSDTANINADIAANIAMLRGAFQSEIRFPSTTGFQFDHTRLTLRNVLITGPGAITSPNSIGVYANDNTTLGIDTVGIGLFTSVLQCANSTTITGTNLYIIGAGGNGIDVSNACSLSFVGPCFMVCQCFGNGISAGSNTQINISAPTQQPRIYGVQQNGVYAGGASAVTMSKLFVAYAGQTGVVMVGSEASVGSGNVSYAASGYVATQGGFIDCNTCATAAVTSGDYTASHSAGMYAAGFVNSAAQFSPTRNTVGNGNSYIEA
jgi:hypothetical protein